MPSAVIVHLVEARNECVWDGPGGCQGEPIYDVYDADGHRVPSCLDCAAQCRREGMPVRTTRS